MNPLILAAAGTYVTMAFMVGVWTVSRRLNNAGYVDVAWSYGFAVVMGLFAMTGGGNAVRVSIISVMAVIWSLRLGTHLLIRVSRHHPQEDARYAALREQFPKRPWLMFFGFFQLQAVLIGVLSLPFAFPSTNKSDVLSPFEIAGALIWLVALCGEVIADRQLDTFRSNPANSGRVCDTGLWRFSRHPNYFFEWVIWIAYFVFACGTPWGWITVYCPLLMLAFLTRITGIPPAEAQSLKSRGDAYRAYQAVTSAFIPWFPGRRP